MGLIGKNLTESFKEFDVIKGGKKTGYYTDTAENRSKHRVGQKYKKETSDDEKSQDIPRMQYMHSPSINMHFHKNDAYDIFALKTGVSKVVKDAEGQSWKVTNKGDGIFELISYKKDVKEDFKHVSLSSVKHEAGGGYAIYAKESDGTRHAIKVSNEELAQIKNSPVQKEGVERTMSIHDMARKKIKEGYKKPGESSDYSKEYHSGEKEYKGPITTTMAEELGKDSWSKGYGDFSDDPVLSGKMKEAGLDIDGAGSYAIRHYYFMAWRAENAKNDPENISDEIKSMPKEKQNEIISDRKADKAKGEIQTMFNYASKSDSWADVNKYKLDASKTSPLVKEYLDNEPILDMTGWGDKGPMTAGYHNPDRITAAAKQSASGTTFIAKRRGDQYYFVETGGYDYPRHMMKIEGWAPKSKVDIAVNALVSHIGETWQTAKEGGASFDAWKSDMSKFVNLSDREWSQVKG
jgi:hypothetical protein